MYETVGNNAERNNGEGFSVISRFMAPFQFGQIFWIRYVHLLFQITPKPEIDWSEVEESGWPRSCKVTKADSIIKVLLQHLPKRYEEV